MHPICVFDVNETLLDLSALDPHFERLFGAAALRREWFSQLLQSAFVGTIVRDYRDFTMLGRSALEMTAAKHHVQLSDTDTAAILQGMTMLPPHDDVEAALQRLADAGFRLATLSNSTLATSEAQIEHAGLRRHFERVMSADSVQRLKPAPEPYRMAAEQLGVSQGEVRLIAAHAWDITGAMQAGCVAAFVARPGSVFDPAFAAPDIMGDSLLDVAEQIIARG
jgi:2-haloacid dehalogenase